MMWQTDVSEKTRTYAREGDMEGLKALKRGAQMVYWLNVKGGKYSRTPLHEACTGGHLEVVKWLISCGADIHRTNLFGSTPLHYATEAGHLDVVKYLLSSGAELDHTCNCTDTPLHEASSSGRVEVVKHLVLSGADINRPGNCGLTPLHKACIYGHLEVAKCLTSMGADVNNNATAMNRWTPLHRAALDGHVEVVKFMVSAAGADIDCVDFVGETPLHYAACKGHLNIVKYLISSGAAMNDAVVALIDRPDINEQVASTLKKEWLWRRRCHFIEFGVRQQYTPQYLNEDDKIYSGCDEVKSGRIGYMHEVLFSEDMQRVIASYL